MHLSRRANDWVFIKMEIDRFLFGRGVKGYGWKAGERIESEK